MPNPPSLWDRLKQARVFQILVVYLGASWVVLQVASTVVSAFKLPDGVLPTVIILMLVGLVIVLATAWVQSLASTTAGEEAGSLPTDWQIAPRDAFASLRRGRLPHLTWGRTIVGGIVVLSLLFGGAGTYVGFFRGGPNPVSASEAAEGIAVVPFDVQGTSLDIDGEGMMSLLTSGLDGVGGFRTIDARTLMARWNDKVGDGTADLAATLDVARATGARYALEGSVVATGPTIRLATIVYDIDTGDVVARHNEEGPAADVLRLVDALAVGTMRSLLSAVGRAGAADQTAETITTTSLPALRAYLDGEAHFRRGRFADAVQSYEKAVAADSTFAIALVRLAETYGWLENSNSARMKEVGRLAYAQAHRLSPRYQFIMTGWDALNRLSADGVASLKEATRKYPDDPGAWFLLAETYIHVGGATYGTPDDIREALQRATTLDPTFAPFLVHLAEYAVVHGDRVLATETMDRYEKAGGKRVDIGSVELAIPLLLGTDEEAKAAIQSASSLPEKTLDSYGGTFARHHDHFDRDAAIDAIMATKMGTNRLAFQGYYAGGQGMLTEGAKLIQNPAITATERAIYHGFVFEMWNVQPPSGAIISADECGPASISICLDYIAIAFAGREQWQEHDRVIARLRELAAAATDTAVATRYNAGVDVLRGVAMHRRGEVEAARQLLTRHTAAGVFGSRARMELAWLEAEANRPAEAIRHFRSVLNDFRRAEALYGIATMFEKLNQPDSAQAYWSKFVTLTDKGDNLPRIVEARKAMARLAQER